MEPHTKAKHAILDLYLKGWFPKLARYNGRILYIDGFAGPGRYESGEIGSPLIALNIAKEHIIKMQSEIVFIFIEARKDRYDTLNEIISETTHPKNFQIKICCNTFNDKLSEIFDYLDEQQKSIAPSFVLIDPFGFSHIPFSVIQRVMSYDKCEVLITFMYDYINRFIGEPDRAHVFDDLFGTPDWKDVENMTTPDERKQFLHDLYSSQLTKVAKIKFVRSFEMVNKNNHTEYFLFFGTNHIEGLKLMKYAMWHVDERGEFNFSDRTDPRQMVLFSHEPNYAQLKDMIVRKFKRRIVSIEKINEFVLTETAFRESHLKKQILKPMENSNPPEISVSNRKRKNTYPEGCLVSFQ